MHNSLLVIFEMTFLEILKWQCLQIGIQSDLSNTCTEKRACDICNILHEKSHTGISNGHQHLCCAVASIPSLLK